MIPLKAFEFEQQYLVKVPDYLPPPYLTHNRGTDQYGYIPFDGNYYWIPGTTRIKVKILEYSNCIKIYYKRKLLIEYDLPPDGTKNEIITPNEGYEPPHRPKKRKRAPEIEKKKLKEIGAEVENYLTFISNKKGIQENRLLRQLYSLSLKITSHLFIKTIKRALHYRITDIKTIERIAILLMKEGDYEMPQAEVNLDFHTRESYLDGYLTDEVDLAEYDNMMEDANG